jgi:hypothetical protein
VVHGQIRFPVNRAAICAHHAVPAEEIGT